MRSEASIHHPFTNKKSLRATAICYTEFTRVGSLRGFQVPIATGDHQLVKRFLYAIENAARMAKCRRANRFSHGPAFAAEFFHDEPVAVLQPPLQSLQASSGIKLGLGN